MSRSTGTGESSSRAATWAGRSRAPRPRGSRRDLHAATGKEAGAAGENPEVVVEATDGSDWLADLHKAEGAKVLRASARVQLGHRRVENERLTGLPRLAAQLST